MAGLIFSFSFWGMSSFAEGVISSSNTSDEVRLALVIEQSDYSGDLSDIALASQEAGMVASSLTQTGFSVTRKRNLTKAGLGEALSDFRASLEQAGANAVGFVYYTGHGAQHPRSGDSYLLGVNARLGSASDFAVYGLDMKSQRDGFAATGAKAVFLVFDACRNLPTTSGFKANTKGLNRIEAKADMLIAYSTSLGDVAEEGVYAPALAEELLRSGQSAEGAFAAAQRRVARDTNRKQLPWTNNLIYNNVCFSGCVVSQLQTSLASDSALGGSRQDIPTNETLIAIPNFYVASGSPTFARNIRAKIQDNLGETEVFKLQNTDTFIQKDLSIDANPRYSDWSIINTERLLFGSFEGLEDGKIRVSIRFWDIGRKKIILLGGMHGKMMTTDEQHWAALADKISDAIYEAETGKESYFTTTRTGNGVVIPAGPLFAEAKAHLLRFEFAKAEVAFRSFVAHYADDPQAGEAQYWLGETLHQQKAYADSGAAYSEMLRKYPEDPKAPDALVKLARAMRLVGESEKACSALSLLPRKYPNAQKIVQNLAAVELSKNECS
ncbi:tol-pal system protein YbgF [Hyphomonas sp.]|uniref:tol-pal system protein YbgF n=1 Tax=Hyphomonas sp. TaxID=87 RepID=UPI003F71F3FE